MRLRILVVLAFAVVAPLAARAQNISTVAGGGPINLVPTAASVGSPAAVRHDSLGNTYILDNNFSRVYKMDHTTGNMSVFAGNGANGFSGDGGPAVNAEMNGPSGMCIDANNNLFIADSDNSVVREVPAVTAGGKTAGDIYTVAGVAGDIDYGGDGGPATSALMDIPDGCSFDSVGNLYIADRFNHLIRVVAATTTGGRVIGDMYTFAGTHQTAGYGGDGAPATAAGALLSNPFDVFVDSHDNVFIAEVGNNVIREVAATTAGGHVIGDLYTVVGAQQTAGGYNGQNIVANSALLNSPKGLSVDANGNIFFADSANQVIREVPAASSVTPPMTAGFIYNVAGTAGTSGYSGNGTAITASLDFPAGTLVDSTGSIFIADSDSNAIRQVASNTGNYTTESINTIAGNGYQSYGGDGFLATDGQLDVPSGVAEDALGNLAIADQGNDLIRGVPAPILTGNLSTIAGEPEFNGFLGDNASAPTSPSVVNESLSTVFDASGNEFIADTGNCIVREIAGGNIFTVAGTDPAPIADSALTTPQCGFSGATGPATSAKLGLINGVAVDGAGNIFFSDSTNNIIWEVAKKTTASMLAGHIYIAAGTQQLVGSFGGDGGPATGAQLNSPTGIFTDIFGNLFIADTKNNVIREVASDNTTNPSPMTAGNIYTVAGSPTQPAGYGGDGGLATSAVMNNPFAVAVDHAGNIFIADTNNQIIREVSASNQDINTVAGTPGTAGFSGDGGAATAAQLNSPQGLALDGAGDLLLADSANNRVRSIANLASVAAVPVASFNPTSVTFLPQPLNIASSTQVVTLTNNGGAALTGIAISIGGADPGDFSQTNTCPGSLNAGLNCTITVTFKPTVLNARSALVSIADNSLGSPQTVTLSGNGIAGAPADVLSPKLLTFTPGQLVGVATTQNITLSNATGTAPLSIAVNGIAIGGTNAGDFSQTNNCGTTVAVGAGCTIMVTFKPTSATPAARTATLTLTDNALDSGQMVPLTGTAVAPADVLTPKPLVFATTQTVGVASTQNITLSNATGTAPLTIAANGIAISGSNAGDFSQTNNCGTTVALGASCAIMVTFKPTSATPPARTATLTLTDNAADTGQTVILSGTAVAPAPSATLSAPATFADQFVGTSSAAQKVTLSNATGTAPLTIATNGIAISGANPGDYAQTNNCGTSLAAGLNCTINVTFTPTTTGARPANITVTDNASSTTQTVSLTGNGFNILLAAASGGSLSQTVTPGQTATYNLQFTATGGAPTDTVNVGITCSGAPALSTLSCPSTQAAPGTFAVTASTTAPGMLVPQSQPEPPAAIRTLPLTLLAVLLSIAAMLAWMQSPAGRMRTVRVALTACLVLLPMSATMFLTGCASSGGSSTAPPPSGGTPAGTYTITVTQTVTGAKPQTSQLTLIVQ